MLVLSTVLQLQCKDLLVCRRSFRHRLMVRGLHSPPAPICPRPQQCFASSVRPHPSWSGLADMPWSLSLLWLGVPTVFVPWSLPGLLHAETGLRPCSIWFLLLPGLVPPTVASLPDVCLGPPRLGAHRSAPMVSTGTEPHRSNAFVGTMVAPSGQCSSVGTMFLRRDNYAPNVSDVRGVGGTHGHHVTPPHQSNQSSTLQSFFSSFLLRRTAAQWQWVELP